MIKGVCGFVMLKSWSFLKNSLTLCLFEICRIPRLILSVMWFNHIGKFSNMFLPGTYLYIVRTYNYEYGFTKFGSGWGPEIALADFSLRQNFLLPCAESFNRWKSYDFFLISYLDFFIWILWTLMETLQIYVKNDGSQNAKFSAHTLKVSKDYSIHFNVIQRWRHTYKKSGL